MADRRHRLLALLLAAPLCTAAPLAFAQETPPASTPTAKPLDRDQQKMLDLMNRGMDLERGGKLAEAGEVYRRWIDEATGRYGADDLLTSLGYRLLAGNLEEQNQLNGCRGLLAPPVGDQHQNPRAAGRPDAHHHQLSRHQPRQTRPPGRSIAAAPRPANRAHRAIWRAALQDDRRDRQSRRTDGRTRRPAGCREIISSGARRQPSAARRTASRNRIAICQSRGRAAQPRALRRGGDNARQGAGNRRGDDRPQRPRRCAASL